MTSQNEIFNSLPLFAHQPFAKLIEEKDKEETTSSGYQQSPKHFLEQIGDRFFFNFIISVNALYTFSQFNLASSRSHNPFESESMLDIHAHSSATELARIVIMLFKRLNPSEAWLVQCEYKQICFQTSHALCSRRNKIAIIALESPMIYTGDFNSR